MPILLSCSKMEQNNMASENCTDPRAAPEREPRKALHAPVRKPQAGPPILNHGLEMLRSSDC